MTEPASERELVYVEEHPKSLFGNLLIDGPDGKCFYFHSGIDERCPNEAVAFTHLHGDRVEMCAEHCPVDVPEPPSTEQEQLVTDGGRDQATLGGEIVEDEPDTSDGYKFSRPQCVAKTADGDRCSNPVRRAEGDPEYCPRHYDGETNRSVDTGTEQ